MFICRSGGRSQNVALYLKEQGFDKVINFNGNNFTRFAAGAILIAIPIATVFLLLQRYLLTGLTSGATKG